jgi:hypothetical protein
MIVPHSPPVMVIVLCHFAPERHGTTIAEALAGVSDRGQCSNERQGTDGNAGVPDFGPKYMLWTDQRREFGLH